MADELNYRLIQVAKKRTYAVYFPWPFHIGYVQRNEDGTFTAYRQTVLASDFRLEPAAGTAKTRDKAASLLVERPA